MSRKRKHIDVEDKNERGKKNREDDPLKGWNKLYNNLENVLLFGQARLKSSYMEALNMLQLPIVSDILFQQVNRFLTRLSEERADRWLGKLPDFAWEEIPRYPTKETGISPSQLYLMDLVSRFTIQDAYKFWAWDDSYNHRDSIYHFQFKKYLSSSEWQTFCRHHVHYQATLHMLTSQYIFVDDFESTDMAMYHEKDFELLRVPITNIIRDFDEKDFTVFINKCLLYYNRRNTSRNMSRFMKILAEELCTQPLNKIDFLFFENADNARLSYFTYEIYLFQKELLFKEFNNRKGIVFQSVLLHIPIPPLVTLVCDYFFQYVESVKCFLLKRD